MPQKAGFSAFRSQVKLELVMEKSLRFMAQFLCEPCNDDDNNDNNGNSNNRNNNNNNDNNYYYYYYYY